MSANKDLFGNDVVFPSEISKENRSAVVAHAKLIQLHGETPNKKCKMCKHFITKRYSKTYFKCNMFRNSNGPSTDWRARWQAFGKFEEKPIK